jgi:hypothetical protein
VTGLATTGQHDLDHLAHEINRQQQLADEHFRTSVQHALKVGGLLLLVKAGLRHGEWLPWLAANVSIAERTAQDYMNLASQRDPRRVADLPLRKALATIAEPRASAPEPPADTTDLGARLREAWQAFDSARETLDRHARAARRRDLADGERAEAAERAAASARQTADLMDTLAAGLRATT